MECIKRQGFCSAHDINYVLQLSLVLLSDNMTMKYMGYTYTFHR